jgi:hypothetical protein
MAPSLNNGVEQNLMIILKRFGSLEIIDPEANNVDLVLFEISKITQESGPFKITCILLRCFCVSGHYSAEHLERSDRRPEQQCRKHGQRLTKREHGARQQRARPRQVWGCSTLAGIIKTSSIMSHVACSRS